MLFADLGMEEIPVDCFGATATLEPEEMVVKLTPKNIEDIIRYWWTTATPEERLTLIHDSH